MEREKQQEPDKVEITLIIEVGPHLSHLMKRVFPKGRFDQGKLDELLKGAEIIMADLSKLQAEVERNTATDQSAIVLLNGLAAKIEELKTDPTALQAFADQLKGSSDALAAAVVANTPAE